MITRRSFFSRLGSGLAGAALAVNMELHSLVPVLDFAPKLPWYYLIEETIHHASSGLRAGTMLPPYDTTRVYWVHEDELAGLGLTHEDFVEKWEDLPPRPKVTAYGLLLQLDKIKKNRGVV